MGFGSFVKSVAAPVAAPVASVVKKVPQVKDEILGGIGGKVGTEIGGIFGKGELGGKIGQSIGTGLGEGTFGFIKQGIPFLKKFFAGTKPGEMPEDLKDLPIGEFNRTPREIEELNKALEEQRGKLRGLEEQARTKLGEQTKLFGRAVDERLSGLLEEAGFQAGEARKSAGISFAGRGLGRSTFAAEAMGEIGQAELEQKSVFRQQAVESKRTAEAAAGKAAQSISDRRVSLANRLRDLERQGLQSAEFQKEAQDIQMDFQSFLTELDLDEQRQGNLVSMISNLNRDLKIL